ncbi:MAG: PEP-CTERM sorting domain-containing protein [Gammaproteobacteria bacterium]|nr:PEP-CTERM sorting domain-containing protein [Gammaproteobacteria bacterium]NND47794.1 PEP-CTERM sorting domain-containing protein [Woeseiaceae bacterium]NNL43838.1 PEP-CTERM sorting domain-containing protein [Woeseiaceae bacterium]
MLYRNLAPIALVIISTLIVTAPAEARSIRVDAGDWDSSASTSGLTNVALGFDFDFFGFSAANAQISDSGNLLISNGTDSANLLGFFDPAQTHGGNSVSYEYATTNSSFNTAGVDAGFRVTFNTRDSVGLLLNQFQISLFDLSDGSTAFEFNYNQLLFGSDSSQIGYNSSLGDVFDLPGALGLSFLQYSGIGDDPDFDDNNCVNTVNAFACNNYFAGAFGRSVNILPDIANGFFRDIDSNGGGAQGRYLFVGAATQVPEPSSLALLALGLIGLGLFRRKLQPVARRSLS